MERTRCSFHNDSRDAGVGGTYARFENPDGNAFGLEGFDEVKQTLESRRRAHAENLKPNAAPPRNWR